MTQDILTFYNYIKDNTSDNLLSFKSMFSDEIECLPDKIVSSKILIKHLQIESSIELCVFQNAFMEYFKYKLLGKI